MLDEEKVRQMTDIAMFEKKEGKVIFQADRRFRSDYLSLHLLVAFFSYTICYLLGLGAWVLCKSDELLGMTDFGDVGWMLFLAAIIYFAGLFLFMLGAWMIYQKRYDFASRGMDVYLAKLKKLRRLYDSYDASQDDYGGYSG